MTVTSLTVPTHNIQHYQFSYLRVFAFNIQHCMSIMGSKVQLYGSRYISILHLPSTALDLDCEREDPSSADVDHCFGLGHLSIFGYLCTSHYILISMRLYIEGSI